MVTRTQRQIQLEIQVKAQNQASRHEIEQVLATLQANEEKMDLLTKEAERWQQYAADKQNLMHLDLLRLWTLLLQFRHGRCNLNVGFIGSSGTCS